MSRARVVVFVLGMSACALASSIACGPPEPPAVPSAPLDASSAPPIASTEPTSRAVSSGAPASLGAQAPAPTDGPPVTGPDPTHGAFSLDDATAGLAGTGALTATIKTNKGDLACALFADKAPVTVANFVGLARGTRPWKDHGAWVKKPAYDGTIFHRVIKGFMIQGGDPLGTGKGEPGYTIKDEIWPGSKHDRPGLLCMANRGKDTNGVQFFITDAAAKHLDGNYTIFGECAPAQVVHDIAAVPVSGERPIDPVTIESVEITRAP